MEQSISRQVAQRGRASAKHPNPFGVIGRALVLDMSPIAMASESEVNAVLANARLKFVLLRTGGLKQSGISTSVTSSSDDRNPGGKDDYEGF